MGGASSMRQLFLAAIFVAGAASTPDLELHDASANNNAKPDRLSLGGVAKTTVTDYNVIDWIPLEAQGPIANAPPIPPRSASAKRNQLLTELQQAGAQIGPTGTVPIPQAGPKSRKWARDKSLPNESHTTMSKRQKGIEGHHWFVSSNQTVSNQGGFAVYSLFSPFVKYDSDYSLIQTAVVHNSSMGLQTVEAGWISYPNQVAQAHLFTFFTTNGNSARGDKIGGWNRNVAGWVQVDNLVFPGTVLVPTSDGEPYDLEMEYQLFDNNWWLWALDRWVGYYPADMFSNGTSKTLASGAESIYYYGEVFSEDELSSTDMGSGIFGSNATSHTAYIRNMTYRDDKGTYVDFKLDFWDSNSTRFNHKAGNENAKGWGNYVYLGGPGAGGVTGS